MKLKELIEETTRDICDISVAPAAKSKVNEILSSFADRLLQGFEEAVIVAELQDEPQNFPEGNGLDYAEARSYWHSRFLKREGHNAARAEMIRRMEEFKSNK